MPQIFEGCKSFKRGPLNFKLNLVSEEIYCADYWKGFNKVIDPKRLYQGKDKTLAIERNHCQQRHWFARFKRKSIVVSRSLDMLEATLKIFAAVHVNKPLPLNL